MEIRSILGPFLFLIYINKLDINIQNVLLKFADDTKLFGSLTTSGDQLSIQNDLINLLS